MMNLTRCAVIFSKVSVRQLMSCVITTKIIYKLQPVFPNRSVALQLSLTTRNCCISWPFFLFFFFSTVTQSRLGGLAMLSITDKKAEAQLPQRNSASAAHTCAADALFLCGSCIGIGTCWSWMHRTPQNRRGCTISDIQTLWFKKCWPKTHFVVK